MKHKRERKRVHVLALNQRKARKFTCGRLATAGAKNAALRYHGENKKKSPSPSSPQSDKKGGQTRRVAGVSLRRPVSSRSRKVESRALPLPCHAMCITLGKGRGLAYQFD